MQFKKIAPIHELNDLVECYWAMEDDSLVTLEQKIISDGYPEIIFHFADPFEVRLRDHWTLQPLTLVAGQMTRHFHLRNTGRVNILGIKFKPAGLSKVFNISMHELTDQIRDLKSLQSEKLDELTNLVNTGEHLLQQIERIQSYLNGICPLFPRNESIDKAISAIFANRGLISVMEMGEIAGTSERQLERLFKKYIGLSPKFYARTIRFSNIFQIVQKRKMNFSELGLESGFYDQSHFIRDFKNFTGDDPSRYFFDEPTMANFFLKK